MTLVSVLARLFAWGTAPDARRLTRALLDPKAAERALEARLVDALRGTRRFDALDVTRPDELRARAPIVGYAELRDDVLEQLRTGAPIVTSTPVSLYERTSGSSGVKKYVPYTPALRRTFARMFRAWAHDLVAHGPRLRTGRFYFSISPSFDEEGRTPSGAPVGVDDDAAYLDGLTRALLAPFFVAPRGLARERDAARFKDETALALLAAHDLEVVSVWSPTFFTVVLDHIAAERERLLALLAPRVPRRRHEALTALLRDDDVPFAAVWPELKILSCWRHGHAAGPARALAARFPGTLVQGKGLLATEGPVTIPLVREGDDAAAPLLTDVLIELVDEHGRARTIGEAQDGDEGELVISPVGGFLRYRLGDRGRVVQTARGPRLRFLGRQDRVCDLVGEKLEEAFVDAATRALAPRAATRTLVPCAGAARYALFVDDDVDPTALDGALSAAFHYRHARALGQLAPPLVVCGPDAGARLLATWEASGRRAGDLKPTPLVLVPLPVDAARPRAPNP